MKVTRVITTIFLIVSAVIGAGFASGEEITNFFGAFSVKTVIFIILFCFIFFLLCYFFLSLSNDERMITKLKNSKINKLYNIISSVVLILTSATMVSMVGTLCRQYAFLNPIAFKLIFLIFAAAIAFVGFSLFSEVNGKIGRNLFIAILISLIYLLCFHRHSDTVQNTVFNASIYNTFLYVALNIFLITELLLGSGKKATKKQCLIISIVTSILLSILLILMSLVIRAEGGSGSSGIIFKIMSENKIFGVAYSIILIVAAFTSLVTSLNAIKEKLHKSFKPKWERYCLIFTLVFVFGLSFFDFAGLVKYLYPVQAILSLIYLIPLIILKFFRNPFFKRVDSKVHDSGE